jgi:cell division septal protein FtsQ
MRMRQSITELERSFHEQMRAEQARRERLVREAERRQLARRRERVHKRGRARFLALCLVLLGTAVLVTVAMFQALYLVMG